MYTEGASGVFVAILVAILGAIVLSAAGLLVLRDQTPLELVTPAATEPVASSTATTAPTASAPATTSGSQSTATTPTSGASGTPARASATPIETPPPEVEYVVVAGDGVEIVASRFGVSAAAIIERNNLQPPYTLSIGQVLVIPTEE